jgi:hypothetical protein
MRHGRLLHILVASLTLGAVALAPGAACAQPTPAQVADGRTHFNRGVALFDQGNHDGALIEFQRAWELSQRPSVLFNIAATCQALHRYADAIEAIERFLASRGATDVRQRRHAQRTLNELRGLVAFVRITTEPADATLTLDGHTQPANGELVIGPGTHRVEAARSGRNSAAAEFTIASGEHRDVRLTLTVAGVATPPPTVVIFDTGRGAPPPPPPPPPATIEVLNAPAGATLAIDDVVAPSPERPVEVRPGRHHLVASAPGVRPWRGEVLVRDATQHRLALSLAAESRALPPVWFWVAASTTGALLISTIATGAAALGTHADYAALPSGSPQIAPLADRGRAQALAADVLAVATVGLGAAAAVLFTRTEFRAGVSTARFVLAPLEGGAAASAWVRF